MLFDKVSLENLRTAVNDLNQKGIPDGFSTSKYYDVKIDGTLYPPKPIMAIANFYATGKTIGNYFSGRKDTPCFSAFRRLGVEIVTKQSHIEESKVFKIIISNSQRDENDDFLNAKLQIVPNGYLLLKGSFVHKEPKPSFLTHSYFDLISSYLTSEYVNETSFNDFYILKVDILFNSPSAAASMVLNRAANGRKEWKLEDGTNLEKFENIFDFSEIIHKFLHQAKTDNLKTKHYQKSYKNTKVKVSFGQGNAAKIPWISFLQEPFTTSDGIYPVYLYYKNINKLILAYGRSETNKPITEWKINNSQSISGFFEENNYEKPDRYGDSHIFKVYDVNNLPDETKLNQDLDEIIEKYSQLGNNVSITKNSISTMKFDSRIFEGNCKDSGLKYNSELITRYIASLATKPFVLLSGLSGSGKTKLAQAFAQWICESEEQYTLIPVGADWTNREPLLGYPNALKDNEYVKPDNDALDLLLKAKKDETRPYFLILDEMNLSHVERYFADFLSTMESKNTIPLHKIDNEINNIPKTIKLPPNLFIVGTVNIDETTYMFSPKVLDRANTIEFRVKEYEILSFLEGPNDVKLEKLKSLGATMATNFVSIATKDENYLLEETQQTEIHKFFKELQKSGAEFGYRTAFEISKLIFKLEEFGLNDEDDKIDIAIMQKMLPKLHGSRTKLTRTLKPLAKFCLHNVDDAFDDKYFNNYDNIDFEKDVNIKYKLSFEKIMRMYKNGVENGFASYAEA